MEKDLMAQRKKIQLKTADLPLSRTLSSSFISDLNKILDDDASVEAKYLRRVWLSKYVDASPSGAASRRQAAIEKWLRTEQTNIRTNARLRSLAGTSADVLPGIGASRFLAKVREIVSRVLPFTPSLSPLHGGFSGGASTSKKRVHGHPAMKFLDQADVTRSALPFVREWIKGTRWHDHMVDAGLEPRVVVGNVMFTVPKNAEIDRVAAKEPDLNMFFQKSLGNQIRTCLKRVGIDLNDQSINGELARIGSIDGSLMTLDLSSASDSVSIELVRLVLPTDWVYYMEALRSPVTIIDGTHHVNAMFSSMGNGFTFELESLLFYSIVRATAYFTGVKGRVSVYGDDIIAPSALYQDLVAALTFCGFSVNPDKSYHEGAFRESCGAHWHGGVDIRPFYLRGPFTRTSDLILTLNQLTSWASRTLGVVDPRYEEILLKYREYIPSGLWGGQDLTSRTSLVTGDRPRKELYYPVEAIAHDHVGGLLFWLFVAGNRPEGSSVEEALTAEGTGFERFARFRRNRQLEQDLPVFLTRYAVV